MASAAVEKKHVITKLTWEDRWKLYHLYNGGMSSRRELEVAIGVNLEAISIVKVYEECTDAIGTERELCNYVWCSYCNALTKIVPCKTCRHEKRGDNFKAPPKRANDEEE